MMKRYAIISFLLVLMFPSCVSRNVKPQTISFSSGGAISDDFKSSKFCHMMGKTYGHDSIAKLTDEDVSYLNSLEENPRYFAFADNVLITLSRGNKEVTKKIVWGKHNTSLHAIARALEGE